MPGPRRRPRSLRVRVAAVAALAVLGVLTAAGAGLVLTQRALLTESLDEALLQQADTLADRVRAGDALTSGDRVDDDVILQVVDPDGGLVSSLPESSAALLTGEPPPDGAVRAVVIPGEGDGRLTARSAGAVTVVVAAPLDDVDESTAALVTGLLIAVPVGTALLAVLLWWAVGRALHPVEDLRARVDRITAGRLDDRVPEPRTAEEIARLARTMNAMLARLHGSADRQRRFVADAAHELRSPLARMRAELEVDAAHPGSADPVATAASVLAETVALQRLVDDLLLLASADAGSPGRREVLVDLDDVVDRAVAATGDPRVDTTGVTPVQVLGDPDQLRRAVGNLLDNALRHARDHVVVTVTGPGDQVEIVVGDDGPGVPADAAERVFERFTRLDEARATGDGGAGLGLAIAREIAERHRGSLELDPAARAGGALRPAPAGRPNGCAPRVTAAVPG